MVRALPDVPTCDNEAIHLLSRIQSFGFLLAVTSDWVTRQVSANLAAHLGVDAKDALGQALTDIIPRQAVHAIRGALQALASTNGMERLFDVDLGQGARYDLAVHRSDELIVIEGQPYDPLDRLDAALSTRAMVARLERSRTLLEICQEAARQVRALTGFDRVMIYRFDDDGAGEVIAERTQSMLEPFLGLHYPATDIPRQARELYLRNTLRIVADVNDPCAAIISRMNEHDAPLDLSLSTLRAVSPVHLAYLRNMGVAASLSISIVKQGELWGLIACHHGTPRRLSLGTRTAAELFGQVFSFLIENRQRETELALERFNGERLARLVASIATHGSVFDNLAIAAGDLRGMIDCDGLAIHVDGQLHAHGSIPGKDDLQAILTMLDEQALRTSFHTDRLHELVPYAANIGAGLLAVPVSGLPRGYLMFFRNPRDHSITWAGDPRKAAIGTTEGLRPRESFAAWNELVAGRAQPFDTHERRLAEQMRVSLLEIVSRLSETAERARRHTASRQDILVAELNHRMRNVFALISGVVALSREGANGIEAFVERLRGRIESLSRAHDQVTAEAGVAAWLHHLLRAEASAWLEPGNERVSLDGPSVFLTTHAFATIALVIHEMMTNAAKYGALSTGNGKIDIAWTIASSASLVIEWRESGGPAVQAPQRGGFGSTIIQRSIPFNLNGGALVEYAPAGVRASFRIPPAFFQASEHTEPLATPVIVAACKTLQGEVMVLEDNLIIALDAEDILHELGASHVHSAASLADAFAVIETRTLTFALLDYALGDQTSLAVAARLQTLGIPFVFASGYGAELKLPPTMAHCRIVSKPYSLASFQNESPWR